MIEENSSKRIITLTILFSAAGLTCLLFIAAFIFFQPNQLSLADQYFPSSTATLTPTFTPSPTVTLTPTSTFTPTITSTPTLAPTRTPNPKTGTAQAFQNTAASNQWRITFSDDFKDNEKKWLVGNFDNEYAKEVRIIKNGKYQWSNIAKKSSIKWTSAKTKPTDDFYLSADVRQIDGSNLTDFGLIFREDTSANFYYFGISNNQKYLLYLYNDGWTTLINSTYNRAINPFQTNRLAVLAEGDHFIFFINDQYIADIHDDTIPSGTTAFAIEMNKAGEQASFEFDNFELREP